MFSELESGIGLEIIVWLQAHGGPLLDALATLSHYLGQTVFYIPVLALVYWSMDKKLGQRMLFALVLANAVITALKFAFHAPRPDAAFPDLVQSIVTQDGFGIPSGHVGVSLAVWGYAAYWLKRRLLWWLLGGYVIIMAWARMYGGVHYPQDVVAGALVGGFILWLYIRIAYPVEAAWLRLATAPQVSIVVFSTLLIVIFVPDREDGMAAAGALLGAGLGYIVETHWVNFSSGGSMQQRIMRYATGIILTLALFYGLASLFAGPGAQELLRLARYAIVTCFATAAWPYLSARLGLTSVAVESNPPVSVTAMPEG
jgi:membrane-associated phospholipid phosphatase